MVGNAIPHQSPLVGRNIDSHVLLCPMDGTVYGKGSQLGAGLGAKELDLEITGLM